MIDKFTFKGACKELYFAFGLFLGSSQSMRHGVARGAHVYLGYGEETELMQQGKTPLKPDS